MIGGTSIYIYICFPQSPEQVRLISDIYNQVNARQKNGIFITIKYDMRNQAPNSISQYNFLIRSLFHKNSWIIPEKYYRRLHSIFLKFVPKLQFIGIILGHAIGAYCKDYFAMEMANEVIMVDDGLVVTNTANIVEIEQKKNIKFFSKYEQFLPTDLVHRFLHPTSILFSLENRLPTNTLIVLGSPLVESNYLSSEVLLNIIHNVMKELRVDKVIYLMHRRELPKFDVPWMKEISDDRKSSLEVVLSMKELPKFYWSALSSSLVDIALVIGQDKFEFFYTKFMHQAIEHSFYQKYGLSWWETLYEVYEKMKFTEIKM